MSSDLLRYPFGEPEAGTTPPQLPDFADDEGEIRDSLDIGSIEQDVYLLNAMLLNLD